MSETLIVWCEACAVQWDLDHDPPACTDPDHLHRLFIDGEEAGT